MGEAERAMNYDFNADMREVAKRLSQKHMFIEDIDGDACVTCGRLESSKVHLVDDPKETIFWREQNGF